MSNTSTSGEGPPVMLHSPVSWWRHLESWFLPLAWADDIVRCDPTDTLVPNRVTSYERSADPFKSGDVDNPNSLIYSLPMSSVNPWDGITPKLDQRYWKCDKGSVVAMSQAEQDAINAPTPDQLQQAEIEAEKAQNPVCNKDRDAVEAYVKQELAANRLQQLLVDITRCERARAE